eukprot:TRINITY_DN393_c0_g1_i2.p1 TRINITY_DN393_c0_g1~~TRINITY_DN393_c0_g1_i2.p1  ORF type:complete len:801 (+),score=53.92 TRINITY_DN393_c0_g1_i2:135-2537(+)
MQQQYISNATMVANLVPLIILLCKIEMLVLNSFVNVWRYILLFLKTYPQIKGTAALCAYYRKKNQSIPLSYLVFTIIQMFMQSVRIITLILTQEFSAQFAKKAVSVLIFHLFINLSSVVYVLRLKNYSGAELNLNNFNVQRSVCQKMQVCTLTIFISIFMLSTLVITGEIKDEPLELAWVISFLTLFFSCVWFSEGVLCKLLFLVTYNVSFCLWASKDEHFNKCLHGKILAPIVFAGAFIVAHDRSVKLNYILKQKLKEQKSVYEKFLQKLQDPVLIVDRNKLIFHNETASSAIGTSIESFYRKAGSIVSQTGETLESSVKNRFVHPEISPEPILEGRYFQRVEESEVIQGKDRTLMITLIESEFFSREKTVAVILRDETMKILEERRRAEEKYKNMMLFSLSHELRTPLNILQDILFFVKKMNQTKELTECYKAAKGAWNYLRNKINDTLTYAQFLVGEFVLHPSKFSLNKFLGYLNKMTGFLLQKKKEDIRLNFDISSAVPDEFWGDKERIEQVLFNLLQNAVKYTNKGTISLKVDKANGCTVFSVSDTGCGLPDSVTSCLSDECSSPSQCVNSNAHIGLGLTISRLICHKMGGDLTATSVFGRGTTFTFAVAPYEMSKKETSPKSAGTVPNEDCKVNSLTRYNRLITATPTFPIMQEPKVTILIVDDNDFNRLVAKRMINKYNVYIEEAGNGREALIKLKKLQETKATHKLVVLMDLDMPIMNGIEATKCIREMPTTSKPYICALTAFASEAERNSCMEAGMDKFMSKPLTKDRLETLLSYFGIEFQSLYCALSVLL